VLLALSVALPYLFHIVVPQGGRIFLPMHFPVQLAGFLISPIAGLLLGTFAPIFNFLISGMPPFPLFVTMMFELSIMGLICGLLGKRFNPLWALIIAILASKFSLALGWWIIFVLGIKTPITNEAIIGVSLGTLISGFPGIAIQILVIPSLTLIIGKTRKLPEKDK